MLRLSENGVQRTDRSDVCLCSSSLPRASCCDAVGLIALSWCISSLSFIGLVILDPEMSPQVRGAAGICRHVPTRTVFVDNFPSFFILPPPADLNIKRSTINVYSKYSSAVANRPRDDLCLSVASLRQ